MSVVGAGASGCRVASLRRLELNAVLSGNQPGAFRFDAHLLGRFDNGDAGLGQFLEPRRQFVALGAELAAVGAAETGQLLATDAGGDYCTARPVPKY